MPKENGTSTKKVVVLVPTFDAPSKHPLAQRQRARDRRRARHGGGRRFDPKTRNRG